MACGAVLLAATGVAAAVSACTRAPSRPPTAARSAAASAAAYASRAAASAAAQASEVPSPGTTKVFADASALQSAAASLATAHPSSAAVASSLEARASEFDASVSAQVEKARTSAKTVLESVKGSGNATGEVSVRGLPTAETGGKRAALVTIINRTHQPASYAVQIDFTDSSGKTVESTVVGTADLPPGDSATPLAFATATATAPKVARAQRY